MDGNQSENDRINQQLAQEALPSQLGQQHQQQNDYTAFFPDDNAQTTAENVTNFGALAPYQNFVSNPLLYMQDQALSSSASSTTTMDPLKQQRVDIIRSNAMQNENEYIYQQYLQMTNNHSHRLTTLDLNLQDYFPEQQQQQQQQQPAIPSRQEQDVFNELLNMASMNNLQTNLWHNGQTNPTTFINNADASTLITQQGQDASCYNHMTASSLNYAQFPLPLQDGRSLNSDITLQQTHEHPLANEYRDYKLEIVQQPSRARMCGFGDKDRRPISPPPILKLTVLTKNGNIIDPETFDISFLVAMCDACQEHTAKRTDGKISSSTDVGVSGQFSTQVVNLSNSTTNEFEDDRYTATKLKNLVGASVASATKLYGLDGKLGIFFIFQNISLRTEGLFRLQFSLTDIGSPHSYSVNTTTVSKVLAVVETDPLIVYTAKKYPGVVQSTPLSKCFARQGIKIPIRKEKVDKAHIIHKKSARKSSLATVDLLEDGTEDDDLE